MIKRFLFRMFFNSLKFHKILLNRKFLIANSNGGGGSSEDHLVRYSSEMLLQDAGSFILIFDLITYFS